MENTPVENLEELSFDDFDETISPPPAETEFENIIEKALTRRDLMGGVISFGLGNFLLGSTALSAKTPDAMKENDLFGFTQIPTNTKDTITVPEGFEWKTIIKWGDPLWSDTPEFDHKTLGNSKTQSRSFGDNNDGMSFFAHENHMLLAANNEYTNKKWFYRNRESGKPETDDDIARNMAAHGISIFEIKQVDDQWQIIKDSPFNRRITATTEIEITGPAAGHDLLKTSTDQAGLTALGTWNNCGNGKTPWGTYLSCEENFNGYFTSSDKEFELSPPLKRYGISKKGRGYNWERIDQRFDISKEPNEPNRHGYIVEVDPKDPSKPIKKRTALGRFKHENAEVVIAKNGKVVIYMGDDERGEFLYKFVSDGTYEEGKSTSQLLSKGTLYVAKFYDDLKGSWLPLNPETTGMALAEICIHTRLAASKVGATTMDRPEWVAASPTKVECFCALTNNKNRGMKPNKGGDETPVGGPNPREKNVYGQILKWIPEKEDHTSTNFTWSLFALAGNPTVHDRNAEDKQEKLKAGSPNINAGNMFNSPDGLAFDSKGMLWIQTDGKYSNKGEFEGMGNNQMLVGNTQTGEIRRFLVGPKECEVTGICWSEDKATLFVGIQHPGEKGGSHFPDGENLVPRSAIISVRKKNGKAFG
jgi:secreted PhoX family phosphatase